MAKQYEEVSADLARVLEELAQNPRVDAAKQKQIEQDAAQDSRGLARCQWLGRCYYCFFGGKWWRIACF
jgi:hypothetical protein